MIHFLPWHRIASHFGLPACLRAAVCAGALALAFGLAAQEPPPIPASAPAASASGQQPQSSVTQQSASEPKPSSTPTVASAPRPQSTAENPQAGGMTEDELKQMLVGKPLYLRGGYLDNSLSFNQNGVLTGHSEQGSYTLCAVEIEKVRLSKRKVELEGIRYGLHFLGALPSEDPSKAVDRVRITPKKKVLRITIDREAVVKPKKQKVEKKKPAAAVKPGAAATAKTAPAAGTPDAEEAKAEIAAAPATDRPANPSSVTSTTSPAHAAQVLRQALDRIFAPGLDPRMMAAMPDFWKLYYKAAAARADYQPTDPTVLRASAVDRKARLLTIFQPESNQYAQDAGVAGMALYHVVVGADGTPGEIAVARPIGFGLDENAVASIRKAKFEPAMKNGKPVPELLDLVVEFRIYSKRTAAEPVTKPDEQAAPKPSAPVLPGPYSVQH